MSYLTRRRKLLQKFDDKQTFLPTGTVSSKMVNGNDTEHTGSKPKLDGNGSTLTDSEDFGLSKFNFSNTDDEDVTHSFMSFTTVKTVATSTKNSFSQNVADEAKNSSQTNPGNIYPWLNQTNLNTTDMSVTTTEKHSSLNKETTKEEKRRNRKKKKNKDLLEFRKKKKEKNKKRKQKIWEQKQKICSSLDFVGAQGKRCCINSLKCFGNLPGLLDEIDSYSSNEDQEYGERKLICKHIKDSMLCMGHAMALPQCKNYVKIINNKLNSTLSNVTDFYNNECETKAPSSTFSPTTKTTYRYGKGGRQGGLDDHDHGHFNTAAIIGGVVGGAILILLIILVVMLCKRKKPQSRTLSKKDGDVTLSTGSSRYKNHFGLTRKQSEVYAEIDESSMHSNQSLSDKRPLPSAPPNGTTGTIPTDHTGYLTPRGSRDSGLAGSDTDSGGYHVLQKEKPRKASLDAYEKLQNEEGEYINPPETGDRKRMNSQSPPRNSLSSQTNKDENYHAYFVLEKENNNGPA